MPLIEVTYAPSVSVDTLHRLADVLPHAVSLAVQCPEEPYDGVLRPGDVEIRFRASNPLDRVHLDVVIEVRSKYFASRADDRQQRVERLHADIESLVGLDGFGVYLALPIAAWEQSE